MIDERRLAKDEDRSDASRDPITRAPDSPPDDTDIGAAASGVAAGAPVGMVVGALAGKGDAETSEQTADDQHWRDTYANRSYVLAGSSYDDYGPAYRYGEAAYARHAGRRFDDVEPELASSWSTVRGNSELDWSDAKQAVRDAWQRLSDLIERALPGDSDRDGK